MPDEVFRLFPLPESLDDAPKVILLALRDGNEDAKHCFAHACLHLGNYGYGQYHKHPAVMGSGKETKLTDEQLIACMEALCCDDPAKEKRALPWKDIIFTVLQLVLRFLDEPK